MHPNTPGPRRPAGNPAGPSYIDPVEESASLVVQRHASGKTSAILYTWSDGVQRSGAFQLQDPRPYYRTMGWSVGALVTALAGLLNYESEEARALKHANRPTSDTSQQEGV